jgi:hypothetical protein
MGRIAPKTSFALPCSGSSATTAEIAVARVRQKRIGNFTVSEGLKLLYKKAGAFFQPDLRNPELRTQDSEVRTQDSEVRT